MYGLLIIYALIAIGCSFVCSVAEAVLLSVSPFICSGFTGARQAVSREVGAAQGKY